MTRRRAAIVSAYAGLLGALLVFGTRAGFQAFVWLDGATQGRVDAAHGVLTWTFWTALDGMVQATMGPWLILMMMCAAPLAVGALVARALAWRRLRGGLADPLEGLRRRGWAMRLAAWAPGAAYLAMYLRLLASHLSDPSPDPLRLLVVHDVLPFVVIALGLTKLGSMVVRELVEPLRDERAPSPPRDEGDIVFSAVAVTARTKGAVGALGVASAAMAMWVAMAPAGMLMESPAFLAAVAAYVAAAAGAAYAFRKASTIAVGIDGVYVGEAASTRFFAYREMDEVRAVGAGDLELLRGGRVVLRLQLHGEDAGRRDEVLARIADAVGRARSGETRGAEAVVQSMTARRKMVAAAIEPPGYREATLTREHLWELVEGAATDAPTRTAAAEALVTAASMDGEERSRLRVAAARVADPRVRVAIGSLARDEEDEGEAETKSVLSG